MTRLSFQALQLAFNQPGYTTTFSNAEVSHEIKLDRSNGDIYECRWLIFQNVVFLGAIDLANLSVGVGIKFIECDFRNVVLLKNIIAEGEDDLFDSEHRNIIFKKCKFEKQTVISGKTSRIDCGISFEECISKGGLLFSNLQINRHGLRIDNSTISGYFMVEECILESDIYLWKNVFNTIIKIEKNIVRSVRVSQCEVNDTIFLSSNNLITGLNFFDCQINDSLDIENNNGLLLGISDSTFKKNVNVLNNDYDNIEGRKLDSVSLQSCTFLNGFYLRGKDELLPLKKVEVKSILIQCSALLIGDIYFENLAIEKLKITGFNTKANIVVSNINIHAIRIEDLYNYAQLVFSNIDSPGGFMNNVFHIVRSNLGKAHLNQINFERFTNIRIEDAVLNDIIVSNINWFNFNRISVHDEEKFKNNIIKQRKEKDENGKLSLANDILASVHTKLLAKEYSAIRETYRQLKYAMEKNGDRPQALVFQSLEMDFYRKYQKLAEKKNYKDRIILWISQTNDFGQNWLKPICIYMGFLFVFYLLIASCTPDLPTGISSTLRFLFWEKLKLIPQLSNPAHDLSKLLDVNDAPGVIYIYDFFLRIITTYFIFQTVTAFRKYVR